MIYFQKSSSVALHTTLGVLSEKSGETPVLPMHTSHTTHPVDRHDPDFPYAEIIFRPLRRPTFAARPSSVYLGPRYPLPTYLPSGRASKQGEGMSLGPLADRPRPSGANPVHVVEIPAATSSKRHQKKITVSSGFMRQNLRCMFYDRPAP